MTPLKDSATIQGFNGLYERGNIQSTPLDHFVACQNIQSDGENQFKIRDGVQAVTNATGLNVVAHFYTQLSTGTFILLMDNIGAMYYYDMSSGQANRIQLDGVVNSLIAGADDFCAITIGNRVFFCGRVAGRAIFGSKIYYWQGGPIARGIAGAAPSHPPGAIIGAGNIDAGIHQIAVSFLTETGFVTPPGPSLFINVTGTQKLTLFDLPIGPPGTVGRVILGTRANLTELFFVPSGTINDNTTTTFDYNILDSTLLTSADYLNDLMSAVPAVSDMVFYHGRLIYIGMAGSSFNTTPDNIMVSNIQAYDSLNLVSGVVSIPAEANQAQASNGGIVLRDILYIGKPNATYAVQDNTNDPVTWPITIIDSGIGFFASGKSIYASSLSSQDTFDASLIVSQRGIMMFTGIYEIVPLSFKIENTWNSLSNVVTGRLDRFSIAHDVNKRRFFISVLGSATPELLVMDYKRGLRQGDIKWSVWRFDSTLGVIMGRMSTLQQTSPVVIFSLGDTIYQIGSGFTGMDLTPTLLPPFFTQRRIDQTVVLGPISGPSGISVFLGLTFDISGTGLFNITVRDKDFRNPIVLPQINLSAVTVGRITVLMNYVSEQIFLELSNGANIGDNYNINSIEVYANKMYAMRPQL